MGKTMKGSKAKQTGTADLLTKEQKQYLKQLFAGLDDVGAIQDASGAISGLLQGYDEDLFQKGIVDPAMRQYQNQILPAVQQRFVDANAGSSSALNQALTQSAEDLSNVLAGQRIGLQSSMAQQQGMGLNALTSLLGQRTFEPMVQGPQPGLLKDLIGAGATLGGAYLLSSQEVKENIASYDKGLEVVRDLNVKQYDYTIPVEGNQKGRIGLIAEHLPEEITGDLNGIKAVDLYGLVAILVNSVKELDKKLVQLEETKNGH